MSINLSFTRVTNENKEALVSDIKKQYDSEGCGVCEKTGAEVFWFSRYSRGAHAKCFKLVEKSEQKLTNTIDEMFKGTKHGERNVAHIRAVQAVRLACASKTIMSFLEKNGVEALTRLFDTVGIEAAKKTPAKL